MFSEEVGNELKEICIEISKRYEIHFIEIGTDGDHVHFLVQSVPTYSPTKIVRTIKSITAGSCFVGYRQSKRYYGAVNFGLMGITSIPSAKRVMRR